jgi:3-oxoacyl-[acyl-carrier protein] reductase
LAVEVNAADPEAVRRAVGRTVEALGGLDILVNNARALTIAPIEEMSLGGYAA